MKRSILYITILSLILISCNRDRNASRKFWKGEAWKIVSIEVESVSIDHVATLFIDKCKIYKELCEGDWMSDNNDESLFYWQFNEKAKELKIVRSITGDTLCSGCNEADYYCYLLSGTYNVIKAKKKEMIFESNSTVGYAGQKVRLVLERVE